MIRKGLGLKQGKGYKNMIISDPNVHSMSAKGIKSKVSMSPIKPHKETGVYLLLWKTMSRNFTPEEIKVLKDLNYTYYKDYNQWSLNRGELSRAETLLGYSKSKTKEKIMKALDFFEKSDEDRVLRWLGYKEQPIQENYDIDDVYPTQTQDMR